MKQYGGYELGKTYHIGYWGTTCKVIELHDNYGWMKWAVTVEWSDGRVTTHCTSLDERDREVN
jgi:predicted acyl esterase